MTQQELSTAHQGMVEKHPYTFAIIKDYVHDKEFVTTKRLRDVFAISGQLAGVMLMACNYERWSRGSSITYRKRGGR